MEQTAHADERLIFLIEKATAIAGSQAKLARMLDIPGQHVTNWLSGYRTCTPEDRARLAGMCGLDANQELIRAIIEKHEGTKKGDDLRHFLGKSLLAIGAVVASSGASAAAIFSTTQGLPTLDALLMLLSTMYIMSNHKSIRELIQTGHAPLFAVCPLQVAALVPSARLMTLLSNRSRRNRRHAFSAPESVVGDGQTVGGQSFPCSFAV